MDAQSSNTLPVLDGKMHQAELLSTVYREVSSGARTHQFNVQFSMVNVTEFKRAVAVPGSGQI